MPTTVSMFFDRPFQVIHGEGFAQALKEQITCPEMRRISGHTLIGSVDQWSDSTDIEKLDKGRLRRLYACIP